MRHPRDGEIVTESSLVSALRVAASATCSPVRSAWTRPLPRVPFLSTATRPLLPDFVSVLRVRFSDAPDRDTWLDPALVSRGPDRPA